LKPRREPYWSRIETGLFIGYRKMDEGDGTWIARRRGDDGKQKYQSLGSFPDHKKAYDHAAKGAQKWARQQDQGVNFNGTVEAACQNYVTYIGQHKSENTKKDAEGRFNRLVYGTPFGRIKLSNLKASQVRDWLNNQIPDSDPETVR